MYICLCKQVYFFKQIIVLYIIKLKSIGALKLLFNICIVCNKMQKAKINLNCFTKFPPEFCWRPSINKEVTLSSLIVQCFPSVRYN